jgi:hypothetical protein
MRDLSAYLSQHLGFDLFVGAESLDHAILLVESRNIIVHNRGIVNEIFRSRVPNTIAVVDQPLVLDTHQIFGDLEFFALSVTDADARAVEKFGLPVVPAPS